MTQAEYEQKKRECWEEYFKHVVCSTDNPKGWFERAFDRAYALGKQEKDAEETPISERLYEEEKSQLEWLYYYLNRAADKQENESVSVAILFEVMERLEDMFGIDLLTNGHGKLILKDAEETVISGWVAIDEAFNQCFLHTEKPIQKAQPIADTGDYDTVWDSNGKTYLIDAGLFPDMDSDSEPEQVEIIIKRKKK